MKIAIAVFVNTPGQSPVKPLLAKNIGVTRALEFYITSLNSTFANIEDLKKLAKKNDVDLEAYWAVAEEEGLKSPFWAKWPRVLQHAKSQQEKTKADATQAQRFHKVYQELRSRHDVVAFFESNAPQISAERLWAGLEPIVKKDRTVSVGAATVAGPTENGGFYFLASSVADVPLKVWQSADYGKNGSLTQLQREWPGEVSQIETDYGVDTLEDLTRLAVEDAVFNKFK